MDYKYSSDKLEIKGFIDKNDILTYVKEEEIFKLVFGFKPEEYDYVISPFREDANPGCWFERNINGKLYFKDFAFKMILDCFEAVQIYFELPNFYKTLDFIYVHLIEGKNLVAQKNIFVRKPKKETQIFFESRDFVNRDANFWKKYGISKQNLIDDKVFSVKKYLLLNSKNGDVRKRTYEICYAYTDFEEGRKKLYFPSRKGSFRFLSNCRKNDIGNTSNIPSFGRQLIISKSYKDCRVLMNQGKYVVWLQNEGMVPDSKILIPLIKGFEDVVVWYDNDTAGIEASQKLSKTINKELSLKKARHLWLPEHLLQKGIKDPSDLIYKKSRGDLKNFIKEKL